MHKPNNLLEFDVNEELDWDPLVDNSRIQVKANDGCVHLTGAVPTYYYSMLGCAGRLERWRRYGSRQ